MKKKLLLIAATHGDESIGLETVKSLENLGLDKYFDVLIANPEALKNKKRFIDADLNRSYPGKQKSKIYEQKIAYDNLKIASQYKYIIDIHEASEGYNDFIIVPRESLSKRFPLQLINLKNILLWPDPKGPISQILKNSIELEFGMKNRNRIKAINKATSIISGFINSINDKKIKRFKQKIFYVYGKLLANEFNGDIKQMKDFRLININDENFYPLLVGQYIKEKIICYKMKKTASI